MNYEIEYEYEGKKYKIKVDETFVDLPYEEQDARLKSSIMANLAQQGTAEAGSVVEEFIGAAVSPFRDTIKLSGEADQFGRDLMSSSLDNMKSGRAPLAPLEFLMGLTSWIASPLTGFFQSFLGEPTETLTEAGLNELAALTGKDSEAVRAANKRAAELTGQTVAIAPEVFGPSGIARTASSILKADRLGGATYAGFDKAQRAAGAELAGPLRVLAGEKAPSPPPTPLSSWQEWQQFRTVDGPADIKTSRATRVVDEGLDDLDDIPVDLTTEGTVQRMSVKTVGDIATDPGIITRVEQLRKASPENRPRLFRDIGKQLQEALIDGEISASGFMKTITDMGLDGKELFEVTVSESARTLQILSRVARQISDSSDLPLSVRQEMKVIADNIDSGREITNVEKFMNGWRNVENFLRGTMVGQIATAMRNTWSQTGRMSIGILDDAIQGGLRGTTAKESLQNVWNSVAADAKALPGVRHILQRDQKLLNDILEGNPITEERLMNRSVHEVNAANKLITFVNTLNILQEKMFRRMAFQARLDKNLKSVGIKLDEIDPSDIPAPALEDAVEHALDISFASSGGKVARDITRAFEKLPALYSINPYPRFNFANALPFVFEHSPLGFAKAFSPRTIADLASGDSRRFSRAASRALLGTIITAKAWEIRNDPSQGGEKYYELRGDDGKVYDTRPYSPLLTPYLFMMEAMKENNTLTPMDYVQNAIGINRIQGTGLVLIDAMRANDAEVSGETLAKFLGQKLGQATVPLRTLKDIQQTITGTDQLLDTKADTWGENLITPTISNFPFAEKFLAQTVSPLRGGNIRGESIEIFGMEIPPGLARQALGITAKKKNEIEAEVERLGLDYGAFAFKSGLKEADRYLGRLIAPKLIRDTVAMMNSKAPVSSILPKAEFVKELEPGVAYKDLSDNGKRLALREMFRQQKMIANKQLKILEPSLWRKMKLNRIPDIKKEYFEERTGT